MNDVGGSKSGPTPRAETGPPPSLGQRRAILILGMHRSGTSALAGALSALGATVPKKTLMGADQTSPSGYFESFAIAVAHDELLASAGSHWHDWRELDPHWCGLDAATYHREKIKSIVVEEFDDEPLILVKDPRICRFVPFTLSIFAELNISPVAILPVRNPLEVARSLLRRNGFGLAKSSLLWLRHVLDAEFFSRHMPRCFLLYEDLLRDWRHCIDRAAERTGLTWSVTGDRSDVAIDRFLATDLRHERASSGELNDNSEVPPLVADTYRILCALAEEENKETLALLDRVRAEFNEGCRIFGPAVRAEELARADTGLVAERNSLAAAHDRLVSRYDALAGKRRTLAAQCDALLAERDVLARERDNLSTERDALTAACNDLRAEREAILASSSWRVTAPLRSLRRRFKG